MAALNNNDAGNYNTATGSEALFNNNADYNTATGYQALKSNDIGSYNSALGYQALYSNTSGTSNTASGLNALFHNTTGFDNTANGASALFTNDVGTNNTGDGNQALFANSSGKNNTASGMNALLHNTIGNDNTASDFDALFNNVGGSNNLALGYKAGLNLSTGSNNIDIGAPVLPAKPTPSASASRAPRRLPSLLVSTVLRSPTPVVVTAAGKLGVGNTSSVRFKEAVKPMENASEAILRLKPVTFRYKEEIDPDGIPQFGLVAEEVERIAPDLVIRDHEGKPMTVRYEAVNAMLLNEFLKAHRKAQQEGEKVQELERRIADQQRQIEALAAGLQKVTRHEELSGRTAARVVSSH